MKKLKLTTETVSAQNFKDSKNNESDLLRFSIFGNNGREFILLENIFRCEAEGYCTWFYLNDGRKLLATTNLGKYEKLFHNKKDENAFQFMRVHHAHLVNIRYIKTYNSSERKITFKDDSSIKVAQRRASQFSRTMNDFLTY